MSVQLRESRLREMRMRNSDFGMLVRLWTTALMLSILPTSHAVAQTDPDIFEKVGIDQKLDSQVPLDLEFVDDAGRVVRLRDYFGDKPVVLTLVYFECPMLCTLILNGTLRAMRALDFTAGEEFQVVTVSIDPEETPALAAAKRAQYLENYQRDGAAPGWQFLTGREDQIQALADAVGFRYAYDPISGEYAHAGGIMVLTPEGRVSRYFYGVEYSARDLRLGLVEASDNRIGTPVDQILLYCFQYNPLTGKYSFAIMSALRVGGVLTLLGIALLLIFMIRRERVRASARA
jgi:protein SCO1